MSITYRPDLRNFDQYRRSNPFSQVPRFIQVLLVSMAAGLRLSTLDLFVKGPQTVAVLSVLVTVLRLFKHDLCDSLCGSMLPLPNNITPLPEGCIPSAPMPAIHLAIHGADAELNDASKPLILLANVTQVRGPLISFFVFSRNVLRTSIFPRLYR